MQMQGVCYAAWDGVVTQKVDEEGVVVREYNDCVISGWRPAVPWVLDIQCNALFTEKRNTDNVKGWKY